jgi:hypothetical protein
VLVVLRPVPRAEVPEVCARTRRLARHLGATQLACDLAAVARPCAVLLDAVGRLQLIARELGRPLQIRRGEELAGLIRLAGLAEVLPVRASVQGRGQAECREQPLGVEERVEPDDPVVDDLDDL